MENSAPQENELHRLKAAVEELCVLNDLAVAASTTLEEDKMLDIIMHKSIKALHAEQGAIQLITQEATLPLKTLIRRGDTISQTFKFKVGVNITGWVLKYQKPLVIENLAADTRFQTTAEERAEIRSLLCVPIHFRGSLSGLLMVINRKSGEAFTAEDQRLLSIIASQAGQLIHNLQLQHAELEERRLRNELAMARKIQQSLLPREHPLSELFAIAVCYEPAEAVAGDYYDFFRLDGNSTGIVIADVSGHGTSAAMVMTLVKGILYSVVPKCTTPAEILEQANTILGKILPPQIFVTMIFMKIDPIKKSLHYANAGHMPLIVYQCNTCSCEFVECRGIALGLRTEVQYEEKELLVAPGDFILAYTDGVTDAADAQGQMFGEERLLEAVRSAVMGSVSNVIGQVLHAVSDFTGDAPHEDDIAMIGINMK